MALLDRYRKSGGFVQLLQLIETTTPQKREQFLKMIQDEDPNWAQAIHHKMLTIDRIFSWDDNTVAEVTSRVHELTLAVALHGLGSEREEKVFRTFSSGQKRRITELKETKSPTQAEIASAYVKIIEEVRNMIKQGQLRFEKFDPELIIEENFEEKIASISARLSPPSSAATNASVPPVNLTEAPAEPKKIASGDPDAVEKLSNQVAILNSENKKLKSELKVLREKLEQIKKIA